MGLFDNDKRINNRVIIDLLFFFSMIMTIDNL
jgi:hypothetical protein